MTDVLTISHHAYKRQARRNLSESDILFVLDYGQWFHSAGALHVFLGRRDLPAERELYRRYAHLEGTILVIHDAGTHLLLITVYRNRQGLKRIKHKAPYDRASHRRPEKQSRVSPN